MDDALGKVEMKSLDVLSSWRLEKMLLILSRVVLIWDMCGLVLPSAVWLCLDLLCLSVFILIGILG